MVSDVHELKIYLALLEGEAVSMEVLRLPGGGCRLNFSVSSPWPSEVLERRMMIEADNWGREQLDAAAASSSASSAKANAEAVDTESEFICANCERAVPSMDNCPHCGSIRTVLRSFWNGERLP